jgi:hypothetical protein
MARFSPYSAGSLGSERRALNRFGGCGQDHVVGLSRTEFLADVGFKLRDREVRWKRKIFSVVESRRRVVVTARPRNPELPSSPEKTVLRKTVRQSENAVRAATPTHDRGVMVAQ